MYGYASLQQTAQAAGDGGFHGFSRNVRDGVSCLDQIADLTARLEQAVCRGTQNALCRVAADHTGNARIRQRRTRIQHPSECMPAHGLNRRVTVHAGRKARTDRNDDRRIRDVRTEVFFARIASTRASGCSSCTQPASGSASTAMMPCSASAAASSAVSARRASTPSTTVSPNRMASEKHTVRRIDVGCGRSVSTRRMPARYSRKAIPWQCLPHRVSRLT